MDMICDLILAMIIGFLFGSAITVGGIYGWR